MLTSSPIHSDDDREAMQAARYTRRPFPAYRFRPGVDPHPTADPRGHSYAGNRASPPQIAPVPPERWRESDEYLYGCDLYNHGYWWEAHEAWEGLWQVGDKRATQACFLHGLIQTAACHLKFFVGRLEGARRLLASSAGYLEQVARECGHNRHMGLALAAFRQSVDAYYAVRLTQPGPGSSHDAGAFPYIRLESG